ncbi:MAG: HesA/MoeB/ThiF family protein, partial [Gammaproteobacteria bacterium]|nr:HesA/MoeB/ThiF family protein [Gammaproteobacteria bacterium]
DLVVDAADNFATSYLLSDACLANRVPLVNASVNRNFGYVGVFCGTRDRPAPSLRALFPRLPRQQLSCDTVGVTGPSVGVMASLQAQEVIKVLINDQYQLLGKLLYADLWQYRLHIVDFNTAPEPPDSQIELISSQQITAGDLVIDVRNNDEIHLLPQPFATQFEIPLPDLSTRIDEIPTAARLVCACRSGQRAVIAAQQLLDHGHPVVAALLPGSE